MRTYLTTIIVIILAIIIGIAIYLLNIWGTPQEITPPETETPPIPEVQRPAPGFDGMPPVPPAGFDGKG